MLQEDEGGIRGRESDGVHVQIGVCSVSFRDVRGVCLFQETFEQKGKELDPEVSTGGVPGRPGRATASRKVNLHLLCLEASVAAEK